MNLLHALAAAGLFMISVFLSDACSQKEETKPAPALDEHIEKLVERKIHELQEQQEVAQKSCDAISACWGRPVQLTSKFYDNGKRSFACQTPPKPGLQQGDKWIAGGPEYFFDEPQIAEYYCQIFKRGKQ